MPNYIEQENQYKKYGNDSPHLKNLTRKYKTLNLVSV